MKITQVDNEFVKENSIKELNGPGIWRLTMCDDGNYGKHHFSVRLKPLKNLTIEELTESFEDEECAFISIELD